MADERFEADEAARQHKKLTKDGLEPEQLPLTSPINKSLSEAGQYCYAGICALSLSQFFEDEWHKNFKYETLDKLLKHLNQPKQVEMSMQALLDREWNEENDCYVKVLTSETALKDSALPLITDFILLVIKQGSYDARVRVLVKHLAEILRVDWDQVEEFESSLVDALDADSYTLSEEQMKEKNKQARKQKFKRIALIGLATVGGGTLIGLTGGLAAPLVAAGAGAIIGGAGAAALGTTAGVAVIGSLFGVAGAGLTGYKMKRRIGAVEEFVFEPLVAINSLNMEPVSKRLHISIAVTGWLNSSMKDYREPWVNLAESKEQYCLRWESKYLLELGQAFDYILDCAVTMAAQEALKLTILSGLLAAIVWPSALVSVAKVIDNPWSVCLQRASAAGKQLAEVLLCRQQGSRPATLIGYSLGARVIFCCLKELAKRKGSEGIVEDVVLLGAPVTADPSAWKCLPKVVAGRIINGYCRGDWLLKFLYRTSSLQIHIAGLQPVEWEHRIMHNIDTTDVVKGHMDYMKKLDCVLRFVGIKVRDLAKNRAAEDGVPLKKNLDKEEWTVLSVDSVKEAESVMAGLVLHEESQRVENASTPSMVEDQSKT